MEGENNRNWQERRLGRTILKTYRTSVDLDDVVPNEQQPRLGPKEDPELQRQIEANEGIFEPLLLEPHPEHDGKYRIIDGDRRWTNSKVLVEVQEGTIASAVEKLAPVKKKPGGLAGDVDALMESVKNYPWTTMASMKGDESVLQKIEEAERLLRDLRKELS